MSINSRSSDVRISPGPYLAKVVNHLDPTYMGSLEVTLLKATPGLSSTQSSNVIVRYCSPFWGNTSVAFEGNNSSDFNDVQKSYGFWMVPPDIGTTVMVIFIDGDINQGFWVGCVPDMFQNQMTPGIAASQYSAVGPGDEAYYGTRLLPVAEYHKSSRGLEVPKPDTFTKPIHPFADRLLEQGLLLDTIRGVTSSSARREVPSAVFGISTPGPLDTKVNAPRKIVGFKESGQVRIPVSRLGGTTFVMDDGDKDGQNELVRIRTRTGHQILLHNSSDLIYIGNSKGTAWIELTSNGKLDIFAQDSVSIHTEADFNLRADRDFNIEAGRNINMKAGGGLEMNCEDRFYLICDGNGKIQISGDSHWGAGGELRWQSGGKSSYTAGADFNITANGAWRTSGDTTHITSNEHRETAGRIEMNGAQAETSQAVAALVPEKLVTFTLPNRSGSAGWSNGNFYRSTSISSIMQRVPSHEPWDQHENINPAQFSASNTDVQVNQPVDRKVNPTAGSGPVPINSNPVAVPSSKSSGENEVYLQSVLIQGGVSDPVKLAAWMAQCKHESGGFRWLKEFASGSAYEGRRDLGNTQPGDGPRYKGRGFIQCTGRDNYKSMSDYFKQDFISNPELIEQVEWAAKSVLWFFNVYKKSRTANVNWDDVVAVTKIVNGGTNGLAERERFYKEYKQKFMVEGINPPGTTNSNNPVKVA